MLNLIIWIMAGAFLGWLASLMMDTDAKRGPLVDVIVGIIGAFVAGLVVYPLVGGNLPPGNFHTVSLLASLAGASSLLAVVHLFRSGAAR